MQELTVYSFEDADGDDCAGWTTQDYSEAKLYARDNECRLVENTYKWESSEIIEDFCEVESEESDEDIQARIDAGVVVLTEHFGDAATWADRIPVTDDDAVFDINDPHACVLHHIFVVENDSDSQSYSLGLELLGMHTPCDHGFCAVENEGERLTELWVETIQRLQTPA